jgi:uncharacterized protein DUF5977
MSLQKGTLVGAPIRVNDSADTYPSAVANEILGGHMSMPDSTTMNAIPAARRQAGMYCYVIGEGNTYQLANDLVTWVLKSGSGGSTTGPGTGGTGGDTTLLSGNFGAWTPLTGLTYGAGHITASPAYVPSFKSDLLAFPTRAIVYFQAQFFLDAALAATSYTIGTIADSNSWPLNPIKKYFICQNIEMFLQITTAGVVSLVSKDGFNLPTGSAYAPYYLDCFYQPNVPTVTPITYSYTRTQNFTINCPTGEVGNSVSYSQTYTSTISLAQATAIAMADPNYTANGQAYAQAHGTCTVDPTNNAFVINNRISGTQEVIFTQISNNTNWTLGGTTPGTSGGIAVPTDTYTVKVINQSSNPVNVQINGGFILATIAAFGNQTFAGPYSLPITVTLT